MVAYLKDFGEQGYFVNFPSKFISADGRTLWLSYSANFTNGYLNTRFKPSPDGSRYAMCLQEVRLPGPDFSHLLPVRGFELGDAVLTPRRGRLEGVRLPIL
jgi:hypothetical protein